MLGMLKKTFATFNCTLLRTVYVAFVRPLLEFAVPVWCPYLKGDIDALERVQHRATRLVKSLRKLPYALRLERLQLTTLATRRERGDMIQIYKTFHRIEKIALIEEPKLRNSLRGHNMSYNREQCKSTTRQEFLTNRSANNWNSLSVQTVNAVNMNQFKSKLAIEMNNLAQQK